MSMFVVVKELVMQSNSVAQIKKKKKILDIVGFGVFTQIC